MLLPDGIPSHDTFSRVFSRLDPVAFSECLIKWVDSLQGDLHLYLGQLLVEEGTNEKTVMPKLIELLELSGAVVTVDAAHTNKSIARQLRGKNTDYVMTVRFSLHT
ncbi:transposase family protein [Rubinisphaera italica]|uniref:H repeat-associated protein N-terminal domain-containing protein n=1 Tax=Rubinisphaera italica TaxID=2527969 RepID=A0A5C5XBX7_9PLAN|nr:transposase family protein [Rubinisphaera italica]TWT59793.1 hypothetical protein Pan54_05030 [Rubinisphaera italica]